MRLGARANLQAMLRSMPSSSFGGRMIVRIIVQRTIIVAWPAQGLTSSVPLHHRAFTAQMKPGLYPSLDELRGSRHRPRGMDHHHFAEILHREQADQALLPIGDADHGEASLHQ